MKVVHVLKKIENIDKDIKELRKLEKSVKRNKSFTTPIFMSIEKQINILLGDRIKLLELRIEKPPEQFTKTIVDEIPEKKPILPSKKEARKKIKKEPQKAGRDIDDDDMPMLTQDLIDAKISKISSERKKKEQSVSSKPDTDVTNDNNVKLLDIALEKGKIEKEDVQKEKDKKVKFFRDNFPME